MKPIWPIPYGSSIKSIMKLCNYCTSFYYGQKTEANPECGSSCHAEYMKLTLVQRADMYAAKAHGDVKQVRKYTGEPYIVHPRAVRKLLAAFGADETLQAAALLHDVIEDCGIFIAEILYNFGEEVAILVDYVTDRFTKTAYPEWNREQRKKCERERFSIASPDAVFLKLADFIDNYQSVKDGQPKEAKLYVTEKAMWIPLYEEILKGSTTHSLYPLLQEVKDICERHK